MVESDSAILVFLGLIHFILQIFFLARPYMSNWVVLFLRISWKGRNFACCNKPRFSG